MAGRSVSFDILANDKVSGTYERIALNTENLKKKLDLIAAKATNLKIDADDKTARAKMLDIQAKLTALGKRVANPRVDVAGLARAEAELAGLDAQLDKFGRKRVTATARIDTRDVQKNGRAIDEIFKGLAALAPAGIVSVGAAAGGLAALGSAFSGAAVGAAAFGAVAVPVLKQLSKDTTSLQTAQDKVTAAQKAGTSSTVIHAQQALANAEAAAAKTSLAHAGSSISLQKAQLALAHAQGSGTSSSTSLAKAQERLAVAQKKLSTATPANATARLSAEKQAELSLAGAQKTSATAATNHAYSVAQAELSVAAAKASAAKSAGSSAGTQAAASRRVQQAQENLALAVKNSPLNKALAAQKALIASLPPGELAAAKQLQEFKDAWKDTEKSFQSQVFANMATGLKIGRQALKFFIPIAQSGGAAIGDLEKDASKALTQPFWREFFAFLSGRAYTDTLAFGKILGNLATGFAGLDRAFAPMSDALEGGLERLSGKFANFGKGATGNKGVQSFMTFVETEGPKVAQMFGQMAKTGVDLAKTLAPLGSAEIAIVNDTLKFLDALSRSNPKLIEFAAGIYTISRASKAVHLTQGIRDVRNFSAGVVGAESASGKVGKVGTTVGKVLGGVGSAFGATGLAATAMGAGVVIAAAGVGYLTYKLITAKSANEKYYETLQKQFGATGNNEKAYANLAAQTENQAKAAALEGTAIRKNQQSYGDYQKITGQFALTQSQLATENQRVGDQQGKSTYANKQAIATYKNLVTNGSQVAKITGLNRIQAEGLAQAVGVDLTHKVGTSDKAQQAWQKTLLKLYSAQVANRDAALGSIDPAQRLAAANQILADKSATTAEKMQAMNEQIQDENQNATDATASSAQFGDTLAQLSTSLGKNTTHAQANAAAHKILSGDVSDAGAKTRQMAEILSTAAGNFKQEAVQIFDSTTASQGLSAGAEAVTRTHAKMVTQLEKTLEKMGVSASEAHRLAERYLALPKVVATQIELKNVPGVIRDATTIRRKVADIPVVHNTKTTAAIAAAEANLAHLKKKIKDLPPTAKVKAEAAIKDAETDLSQLETRIYDLVHKTWTVTINSNGDINTPNPKFGPVATGRAAGGFMNFPGTEGVDSIPTMLAPKEYVTNSKVVSREGVGKFDALNAGKATIVPLHRAGGGLIDITAKTNALQLIPKVDGLAHNLASAQKYAKSAPVGGNVNFKPGAGVAQWSSLVLKALALEGQPASLLNTVLRRMNQESGGNPNAINRTDINAQRGDPSRGLMQTIMSTFRAYHWPGTSNNIYDPWANVLASFGYALSRYGSLAAAFNRPGGYAVGGYTGDGGKNEPAGVVHRGEFVINKAQTAKNMPLLQAINSGAPGYASGGKVAGTNFTSSKMFEQAGQHLIAVILSSLSGSRSQATIKSVDNSILHSIDADFTGASRSGLVSFTKKVNSQMEGLAKKRATIASRMQAANELSTTVKQGAQTFADISGLDAGSPLYIGKQLQGKLTSITHFAKNIATLQKRGLSRELLTELVNAGIDQSAPIAERLVKATSGQIHKLNATERAIGRASNTLGKASVNATFGASAAHDFAAGLKHEQASLDKQMSALAKVFARGVGKAFHIKGYAGGGRIAPGEIAVVGEAGPEIAVGGSGGTTITPMRGGSTGGGASAQALYAAVVAALEGAELTLSTKSGRTVATLAHNPMNKRMAGLIG